jgi:putative nucleotidyltransferase with HDIG domain
LIAEASELALPEERAEVARELRTLLLATAQRDPQLTESIRSATAAAIPPVTRSLAAGEVIVRQGEAITPEILATLTAIGLYSPESEALGRAFVIALGAILLGVLATSPLTFAAERLLGRYSAAQLASLVALSLAVLLAQRLAIELSPNFVFVLLVPLLVAVLVSEEAALLWAVWIAVVTAVLVPAAPLLTLLATLAGALVAIRVVRNVRTRPMVVLAGAAGGVAGGVALVAWVLMGGGLTPWATAAAFGAFLAGGVLAGIVALGVLPLFEAGGDFLTSFRLLELSSPSHPLLQRLLLEAPGSYQHSLIISNLVEPAVAAIGGQPLLARVGALYHDIGKIRRPHFFVENQFGSENPHNTISPNLSYLIITSHVRDGLELMRRYRMPRELDPFLAEHHGTTVLAYFYKRALESSETTSELSFRYGGPRPQSKETAVLMLADAVESASRTLSDPSQGSIRALIDRLIEQRLQDDQLSESNLNLRDLEVVAATFERMLTAIMHRRIQYPSPDEMRTSS